MKNFKVLLNMVEDVTDFVSIVSKFSNDIDACRGRYVVDAASIMALFGMDLSKPLDIVFHGDDNCEETALFEEAIKKYIVQ